MHGGAAGSGAPKGERNGNYRHGHYTAEAIAERLTIRKWVRDARNPASRRGHAADGLGKTTLARAIKAGRLSATWTDLGTAELARVYPFPAPTVAADCSF
jgi:hypothetical protein